MDTQEQVAVHMYGFDEVQRGNYLGDQQIRRTEGKVRVGMIKIGQATGMDDILVEMIKHRDDRVVDWIWRLCKMAFESGAV